ncbi:MAG TPA: hypothetical protein VMU13_01950 [Candidatus Paceibacterota bacterium]|nr:hypothetical protein [Candidatus Paceibacterota bacterium]
MRKIFYALCGLLLAPTLAFAQVPRVGDLWRPVPPMIECTGKDAVLEIGTVAIDPTGVGMKTKVGNLTKANVCWRMIEFGDDALFTVTEVNSLADGDRKLFNYLCQPFDGFEITATLDGKEHYFLFVNNLDASKKCPQSA